MPTDAVDRKRRQNERKFNAWEELPTGGRRYWYDVPGRTGWLARYVKEVDTGETTTLFLQEIYDHAGRLVEIHQKYPVDLGHRPVEHPHFSVETHSNDTTSNT
jgi:hypothetical protein